MKRWESKSHNTRIGILAKDTVLVVTESIEGIIIPAIVTATKTAILVTGVEGHI